MNGSAFEEDLQELITTFGKTGVLTFPSFRAVWKEMNFTEIFTARPEDMEEEDYIQELYKTLLGFLYVSQGQTYVRLGVVFALYLLYQTKRHPKVRIKVDPRAMRELLRVQEELVQYQLVDGYRALHQLRVAERAFMYVVPMCPAAGTLGMIHDTDGRPYPALLLRPEHNPLCKAVDVEELQRLDDYYELAKANPALPTTTPAAAAAQSASATPSVSVTAPDPPPACPESAPSLQPLAMATPSQPCPGPVPAPSAAAAAASATATPALSGGPSATAGGAARPSGGSLALEAAAIAASLGAGYLGQLTAALQGHQSALARIRAAAPAEPEEPAMIPTPLSASEAPTPDPEAKLALGMAGRAAWCRAPIIGAARGAPGDAQRLPGGTGRGTPAGPRGRRPGRIPASAAAAPTPPPPPPPKAQDVVSAWMPADMHFRKKAPAAHPTHTPTHTPTPPAAAPPQPARAAAPPRRSPAPAAAAPKPNSAPLMLALPQPPAVPPPPPPPADYAPLLPLAPAPAPQTQSQPLPMPLPLAFHPSSSQPLAQSQPLPQPDLLAQAAQERLRTLEERLRSWQHAMDGVQLFGAAPDPSVESQAGAAAAAAAAEEMVGAGALLDPTREAQLKRMLAASFGGGGGLAAMDLEAEPLQSFATPGHSSFPTATAVGGGLPPLRLGVAPPGPLSPRSQPAPWSQPLPMPQPLPGPAAAWPVAGVGAGVGAGVDLTQQEDEVLRSLADANIQSRLQALLSQHHM
ncbi:putative snRNA-activating protein complex subunit 1 [Paratrimastix pyriformis]|uniref:snRNA-activating protein complex subunit 1 n=1 Tax=Paratrimastix pyriformis TaxID=342808 RepID=A0ABQ8UCA2_9EUKA|nr:putative snRNA-activating protein complex subunit 1 [Paratrimastix pyriformis]